MSDQNNGLEERLNVLEEFLVNTHDVGWFRGLLKNMLFEFRYRGKGEQEPAKTFYQMEEELRYLVDEERGLEIEYDRMMWKGDYENQDKWNYLEAMASEVRRIWEIPENAPVHLVEGSDEWNQASARVIGEREKFLGERRGEVDKNYAFNLLLDLARMRVDIYAQLVKARQLLASSWRLAEQDYPASFTSGSGQAEARLRENIVGLIEYVDIFPGTVAELVQKYPRTELLELRKALPEATQRQLRG